MCDLPAGHDGPHIEFWIMGEGLVPDKMTAWFDGDATVTRDEEVAVARVGARLMGLKDCDCQIGLQPHWTDALRVYSVNDVLFMLEQRRKPRTQGEQKGEKEC